MRVPYVQRSAPIEWPVEVDRDQVRDATSRLVAHVSGRVEPDGAIREQCQSRVLESALALSLLTRVGVTAPARDRLLAFLDAHRDSPERLDRVLARLAVSRATSGGSTVDATLVARLTDGVLGAAPGFISGRRRRMVGAVLSVLGCPLPGDLGAPADGAVPTDPMHSWAVVQQAAVTLILAAAAGVSNPVTDDARDTLLAIEPGTSVWEGYVLMHLLALHGLAGVPGQEATVRDGVRTLLRYQRDDGGFPFVVEMHHWCTATAGLGLAAAGAPTSLLRSMGRMLVVHQGGAPLARSLSRGTPLTDGWSMSVGVAQNDVDCTACALEFLQVTDPVGFGGAVRRGVRSLLAVQGADGGFPTFVAGAASEPCMTAAAVGALASIPATAPARARALAFLADSQLADGGFEPGWSRSRLHALFRARLAAYTAHPDDCRSATMAERIERTVRETQNDDGGWGMQPGDPSDDVSTAYGLITLCYGSESRPVGRALSWLLGQQHADGGYRGVPDMVGPRPFTYHLPVLTDAPVLLAFGHVRCRTRDRVAVALGA
ncbi:terpene cyclase/mutase family protein [Micromonospora sp. WMMD1120]|uniref:prenyltransferase/squalene oxidase repeat-containing protein n=1 Tax=Micromonospora sp. WMMD1120 TaxID=3016106 RepID=UPI002415FD58|nr:prenyltransferase/squalene oxidase repeat-containing protein [Micromonospora sp. WMMD1120]MDG4809535.1 terpene cyclase/mutase family protein [Micromonospora sp. WMMD1120]